MSEQLLTYEQFVELAHFLTDEEAEAWFRRRVKGQSRDEVASEMDRTAGEVDELEREAYTKITKAGSLLGSIKTSGVELADVAGIELRRTGNPEIGVCAVCDEGSTTLLPDPFDTDEHGDPDGEDARQVCPDCRDFLAE
jgi:hypothetical protein